MLVSYRLYVRTTRTNITIANSEYESLEALVKAIDALVYLTRVIVVISKYDRNDDTDTLLCRYTMIPSEC